MTEIFTGNFTQQTPIPEAAQQAALRVMQSGRLHRYNLVGAEPGEVGLLEQEYAAWQGARYCLAVASGGAAMALALRAAGVQPGEAVLTNAFTLAPVPGAVAAVGARPVYVEVTGDLVIDLDDLSAKIGQARVLLLSHMRGHLGDMDRLMQICDAAGVTVIEDCAHTMGARWNSVRSGQHGRVACFSTQTYKHMNSGEGGFLTSDDATLMARATILSGAYMFFDRHPAGPSRDAYPDNPAEIPNMSCRMDNLRAALLRPQLATLDASCADWNARYGRVEDGLRNTPGLTLIARPEAEAYVGSSIQFRLPDWPPEAIAAVLSRCKARGVELKWFGAPQPTGFTSRYEHWSYSDPVRQPATDRILAGLLDMRLPLTFSLDDCTLIARIIRDEVIAVQSTARHPLEPTAP
ncbi:MULTISPECIES: DegT/DnrJ/EryC1/StrS family aminotransferase [unclassified Meridianimarinicoccus]|uniref:DegT/DnrJ/EryC1/StrS family aminotransferase n=1 Tax=unclassified Meridianimarinicoccus TaxID=2923344 RepID=UPI001868B626|nr:aminotransferase class I/II-fold pyridoxal phosphate-dependent enzyme [Fluviibacterium sp. MJW13]